MKRTDLGWTGTLIIVLLAVGLCWLAAKQTGHNGCPWPDGDPRNPTGCVIYDPHPLTPGQWTQDRRPDHTGHQPTTTRSQR